MKVFISHSSRDKPAVLQLAAQLAARGFEPWVDKWEIGAGDNIVEKINQGLAEADAGLIVFSPQAAASRWVQAEWSALTFARIEQGKVLIPLVFDDATELPPLLAPLLRRRIDDVDGIADGLRQRAAAARPAPVAQAAHVHAVHLSLRTGASSGCELSLRHGEALLAQTSFERLPTALEVALATFGQGFGGLAVRDRAAAAARAREDHMHELGRLLGALCLPGEGGAQLQGLVDACTIGQRLEFVIEADMPWLGLPFEAMRLPDGRLLATQPPVVMWRRPAGLVRPAPPALPGPLKLLVAVGAPDEVATNAAVLNQESELQNILDAVEPLNRLDSAQVRILEVGHPDQVAMAFAEDAYHVLHISCHARPGQLELEDEDGRPVPVAPADLLRPVVQTGRPLPLVVLNACHGGVAQQQGGAGSMVSFASALLAAGVPAVVAMQTAVTDAYATELARAFYAHLARGEHLRPSLALALARKELEATRQQALKAAGTQAAAPPEYATAALYLAGAEAPLADFGADRQPLRVAPVHGMAAAVPQLRMDELIGRRAELRQVLRSLREAAGAHAGVVITGIGGVGKSALAGRAVRRLVEGGWLLAETAGRYSLASSFRAVGSALRDAPAKSSRELGQRFAAEQAMDDHERLRLLHRALAEYPVLLVLDDFEQTSPPAAVPFSTPMSKKRWCSLRSMRAAAACC